MRVSLVWSTAAASFVLSIVSSLLAESLLSDRIAVFGSVVGMELRRNSGFAFGLSLPEPIQTLLIFFALGIVGFLSFGRKSSPLHQVGCGLIIGGAFGNIVDRLLDGFVTDFFQIGSFPVFNVADGCITAGALVLLWEYVKESYHFGREMA